MWEGITLQNTAFLSLDDCIITDAIAAITAQTNVTDPYTNISLSGTTIQNGNFGLNLAGNINMQNFEANKFIDLETGVFFTTGTSIDLSASDVNNVFLNVETGIKIEEASAFIEKNIFSNVPFGIDVQGYIANIALNTFHNNNLAIKLKDCVISSVFGNQIGTFNAPVERAIHMTNVISSNIVLNECHANTFGIQGEIVNVEINNNIINTYNTYNQNSGGIRLTMANESDIHHNDIYANGGTYGIEMIDGFSNTIRKNQDVAISGSAYNRAAAIRLLASTDDEVTANWVDSYNTHKGIIAQNSGANTFDCNIVQQSTEALHIIANSEQQLIRGNTFSTSATDLQIESVIGEQDHLGNTFLGGNTIAVGLSVPGIQQSAFNVNSSIPFHLPTNPDPATGWFNPELEDPYECPLVDITGPVLPTYDDVKELCKYYNSLKPLYTSNPRLYFIKVYHLMKYVKVKSKVSLPECITTDPLIGNLCGLLHMIETSVKITKTTAIDSTDTTFLQQMISLHSLFSRYNENTNPTVKASQKDSLMTEMDAVRPSIKDEVMTDSIRIDSIEVTLDTLQCVEQIVKDWKLSYKQLLRWLQSGKLLTTDSLALSTVALKCSDEYGDGVHVARTILSMYNGIYYDEYDDCNSSQGAEERPTKSVDIKRSVSLSPNPSGGRLDLSFETKRSGTLQIYAADGRLLKIIKYDGKENITFDLYDYTGIVFVKIHNEGMEPMLKKALIIK